MKNFITYLTEESNRKHYFRGTNNSNEEALIKARTIRPSINHITGQREIGLSVSDVEDVGNYFKYMYELSGIEVGEGSDGEPLLDLDSIRFIRWIKK